MSLARTCEPTPRTGWLLTLTLRDPAGSSRPSCVAAGRPTRLCTARPCRCARPLCALSSNQPRCRAGARRRSPGRSNSPLSPQARTPATPGWVSNPERSLSPTCATFPRRWSVAGRPRHGQRPASTRPTRCSATAGAQQVPPRGLSRPARRRNVAAGHHGPASGRGPRPAMGGRRRRRRRTADQPHADHHRRPAQGHVRHGMGNAEDRQGTATGGAGRTDGGRPSTPQIAPSPRATVLRRRR